MLPNGSIISTLEDQTCVTQDIMDMENDGLENFMLGNHASSLSSYGEIHMKARGKQLLVISGKVSPLLDFLGLFLLP
jgi:hypothetical protein